MASIDIGNMKYCAFLLKLGRKLKLDTQQKIKAKKVYQI